MLKKPENLLAFRNMAVVEAKASIELEGQRLPAEVYADALRYVAGEIVSHQIGEKFLETWKTKGCGV